VLQPAFRRIARWAITERRPARLWLAREVVGWPAPQLVAYPLRPVAFVFARWVSGVGPARVREDLAALPAQLDRVDELIETGVIGGPEPSAADCQIFGSLRLLLAMRDLAPAVVARPCGRAALALAPHFPAAPPRALPPVPEVLPAQWLPPQRGSPSRSASTAEAAIAAARTRPSAP
jgi:glutathione S-transferase